MAHSPHLVLSMGELQKFLQHGQWPSRICERQRVWEDARLGEASKTQIKAALEAGAQGLIFPMIESREQLDRAIEHIMKQLK